MRRLIVTAWLLCALMSQSGLSGVSSTLNSQGEISQLAPWQDDVELHRPLFGRDRPIVVNVIMENPHTPGLLTKPLAVIQDLLSRIDSYARIQVNLVCDELYDPDDKIPSIFPESQRGSINVVQLNADYPPRADYAVFVTDTMPNFIRAEMLRPFFQGAKRCFLVPYYGAYRSHEEKVFDAVAAFQMHYSTGHPGSLQATGSVTVMNNFFDHGSCGVPVMPRVYGRDGSDEERSMDAVIRFFAGKTGGDDSMVQGISIQDLLQRQRSLIYVKGECPRAVQRFSKYLQASKPDGKGRLIFWLRGAHFNGQKAMDNLFFREFGTLLAGPNVMILDLSTGNYITKTDEGLSTTNKKPGPETTIIAYASGFLEHSLALELFDSLAGDDQNGFIHTPALVSGESSFIEAILAGIPCFHEGTLKDDAADNRPDFLDFFFEFLNERLGHILQYTPRGVFIEPYSAREIVKLWQILQQDMFAESANSTLDMARAVFFGLPAQHSFAGNELADIDRLRHAMPVFFTALSKYLKNEFSLGQALWDEIAATEAREYIQHMPLHAVPDLPKISFLNALADIGSTIRSDRLTRQVSMLSQKFTNPADWSFATAEEAVLASKLAAMSWEELDSFFKSLAGSRRPPLYIPEGVDCLDDLIRSMASDPVCSLWHYLVHSLNSETDKEMALLAKNPYPVQKCLIRELVCRWQAAFEKDAALQDYRKTRDVDVSA